MRLVVSYVKSDECTYSCDVIKPVSYESAEKLLVDLEAVVNRFLADNAAHDAGWAEFYEKFGTVNWGITQDEANAYIANRKEYRDRYPPIDPNAYSLTAGSILWIDDFIYNGKFEAPQIYTVDEWFAKVNA